MGVESETEIELALGREPKGLEEWHRCQGLERKRSLWLTQKQGGLGSKVWGAWKQSGLAVVRR